MTIAHWKTTAQAWLTVLIGVPPAIAEFTSLIPHKISLGISLAAAIGKVVLGQLQKDAGVVEAIPAGGSTPVAMPSTEVPLQPGAVVVANDAATGSKS